MISLLKILFTVAVVYLVWFLFKYRARMAVARRQVKDAEARAQRGAPAQPTAQDLLPCPKCGAYVAAGGACTCEKV